MNKGDITKEKIKNTSRDIFHRQGFNNTSIYDILNSSGVKKGSFFFHFPTKKDLFMEVLHEAFLDYDNYIRSGIKQASAIGKIEDIVKAIESFQINGNVTKGCIFGNLALEIGNDESDISKYVEKIFKKWEKRFYDLLLEAEKNQEISLKEPPMVFARIILASIQGGVLLSKISGNSRTLRDCVDYILFAINERKLI